MINENNDKHKQFRRTHEDVIVYQQKLLKIVENKIKDGDELSLEEKEVWLKILSYSLLSWGSKKLAYIDLPSVKIPLGDVHSFAMKFLKYEKTIIIKFKGNRYTFPIKTFWELFYDYLLEGFGKVQDQAFMLSKEAEYLEPWEGYQFTMNRKMDDG